MNDTTRLLFIFGASLGLTLLLEFGTALIFRMRGRDLLLLLLTNILTNPAAVYINLLLSALFPDISVFLWQIPLEAAVVLAEGSVYRKLSVSLSSPYLFAVAANAFSYGVGVILNIILK